MAFKSPVFALISFLLVILLFFPYTAICSCVSAIHHPCLESSTPGLRACNPRRVGTGPGQGLSESSHLARDRQG